MKIIIPVNEENENTEISQSFGRAPFYMIYDTETKKTSTMINPATESPSGAGIKAAQTIVDSGAKVLLTIRCGKNAHDVLKGADIKVMEAAPGPVKDNLNAYLEGKLSELETIHEGHHGAN